MSEPPVRIPITAEDRFSSTFRRLKSDLADTKGQIGVLTGAASRLAGVLGAGGAIGVGGFGLALRKLSDDISELNDASAATGSTVENISRLDVILRRNGGNLEVVSKALVKLNQALSDPNPDSRAAQALRGIGLEVAELKRQDPAAAFETIATRLDGFADNGEKARLVMAVFGEDVRTLGATLKDVAAAGDVNANVTARQASEAAKFSKAIQRLEADLTDAGRGMALYFLPAINELFDTLKGNGPGLIDEKLAVPLQAVAVLGANVAFVLRGLGTEIGALGAQAAAVARGEFSIAREIGRLAREDARLAREEFDKLERRLMQIGAVPEADYSNEGRNYGRTLPGVPTLPPQAPRSRGAGQSRGGSSRAAAEERQAGDLDQFIRDQLDAQDRRFESLLADTTLAKAKRAQEQIGILREMLSEPGIDADRAAQILEAIEKIKGGLEDVGETGRTEFDKLADAMDNFAENSIEAILDFAETGELSAKRLFNAFRRDLLRELIEEPIRDTMREVSKAIRDSLAALDDKGSPLRGLLNLLKGDFGPGGGPQSWLSDLVYIFGGFFGRSSGGEVGRGNLVRWQENGREWFVPQEDGTVLTQAQLRQMQGGGLVYAPTLHVNGDVGPGTVQLMRRMLEEDRARLMRSMQHGRARMA